MGVRMTDEKLYNIVKRAVEEVFSEKLIEMRLAMIPEADEEEMREIENKVGDPSKYHDEEYTEVDLKNVDL